MTTEAIETANDINRVRLGARFHGQIRYEWSDPKQRQQMEMRVSKLLMRADTWDTKEEGFRELLERITLICSSYPFVTTFEHLADGTRRDLSADPKDVPLRNLDEVRTWAADMKNLLAPLVSVFNFHQAGLLSALDDYEQELRTKHAAARAKRPPPPAGFSDPYKDVEDIEIFSARVGIQEFARVLNDAGPIAENAQARLAKIDRYRARLPRKGVLLGASVLGSLVFVSGVVLPMVCPTAPALFVAWVPGVAYMLSLAGLIVSIWRAYGRWEVS